MALAYVQQTATTETGADATHNACTITGVGNGNLLIAFAFIITDESVDLVSGTDTSGDTVTLRGSVVHSLENAPDYHIRGATVVNASNTANHTISFLMNNTVGAAKAMHIIEVSGQHASAFFDVSANGNSTGGSPAIPSTSITTAEANELLVGALVSLGSAPVAGTGVTIRSSTADNWYERGSTKAAASSGSNTMDFTNSTTGWAMQVFAIKQAGGAGTTPLTFTATDSLAGGELL